VNGVSMESRPRVRLQGQPLVACQKLDVVGAGSMYLSVIYREQGIKGSSVRRGYCHVRTLQVLSITWRGRN